MKSLPSEEGLFCPSEYYFIALAVHWKLSLRLIGSIILHTGAARMGQINLCGFNTIQYTVTKGRRWEPLQYFILQ